jgi:hypothetical protein
MFDVLGAINWLAVVLGWIAFTVLGGLWFAVLFPKAYNTSLGRAADAAPSRAPIFIVGPSLCALVITITTAVFIYALNIGTYPAALQFAVIAGLGYLAANTTNIAINPNFPRPLRYALISGSYNLVGIVIVSLVIVALR